MPAAWRIEFRPSAEREIAALDPPIRRRIMLSIGRLSAAPYAAANVKALAGAGGEHRLRVGDWRVIYTLDAGRILVLVLRVGHRREVYR